MKWTAEDLAKAIGARLEGDATLEITGVAAPERAGAKQVIYVEAAKHSEAAAASPPSCVIAPDGIALPGKTVLRSAKPKVAFAKAAALLLERAPIAIGIHATAIVAPLARIGANVGIGPYAVIGEDVHLGDGTQIGAHCVIGAGSWIGADCRIHPRVTFYAGGARGGSRGNSFGSGAGRGWIWLRVRWGKILEISAGGVGGDCGRRGDRREHHD